MMYTVLMLKLYPRPTPDVRMNLFFWVPWQIQGVCVVVLVIYWFVAKKLLKRVSSLQDPNEIVDHLGDTLLITSVEQPPWCFTRLYQLWWPCSRLCKGYKNVGKVRLKTVFAGQWLSLSDRFWTLQYCCMHTQDALAPHMAFCNFSVRVEGKS